jgi:type I restriction enzyme R subunit
MSGRISSRRRSQWIWVCVFGALAERRPEWASGEVDQGVMKIVFHGDRADPEHLRKHALRESQQKTVVDADDITDLYAEAGIGRLDITRLNEEQLRKLEDSETPHLVTEALRRLIEQKTREVTRHNVVRHESFSERLDDLMRRYMLEQLTSAQVIAELAAMAREVSQEARRGERFDPPLNHAELAFYDAVAQRDIAQLIAGGDEKLAEIARALVADIRKNLSVDWLSREPVRAKLRTRIRRVLALFDYPPEEEREAVDLVLKQMETVAALWAPGAK